MTLRRTTAVVALSGALTFAGCGAGSPRFTSTDRAAGFYKTPYGIHQMEGIASYYAEEFQGRKTADGETYDMNGLSAAHRTLPFGTVVRVTNKENGKSVAVRINDRGPFKGDRVIDLSLGAAKELGMMGTGTAAVVLEVVKVGEIAN